MWQGLQHTQHNKELLQWVHVLSCGSALGLIFVSHVHNGIEWTGKVSKEMAPFPFCCVSFDVELPNWLFPMFFSNILSCWSSQMERSLTLTKPGKRLLMPLSCQCPSSLWELVKLISKQWSSLMEIMVSWSLWQENQLHETLSSSCLSNSSEM